MPDRAEPVVVRNAVDDGLADELVEFWTSHGALREATARARAADAVCVLRAADGRVVGVNTASKAEVPLLGNRRFWRYRRFIDPEVDRAVELPFAARAFDVLEAEFDAALAAGGEANDPLGVCWAVADTELLRRHPEAVWPETAMLYAGYGADGSQVRIRYFTDAALWGTAIDYPLSPPEDDVRFELYPEESSVAPDDIVALWLREGAMTEAEAHRRLGEVFAVAVAPGGDIAGVCTVYLEHLPGLRAGLWHYRAFVPEAYRRTAVGVGLGRLAVNRLEERFVSGIDARGRGIVMVLENEALTMINPRAHWRLEPFNLAYLGEDREGHHIRLRWFPGATAPPPP